MRAVRSPRWWVVAIAALGAFVLGRIVVGSIAWACSCGPTGLDEHGRYSYYGGEVYLDDEPFTVQPWPFSLVGTLALDDDQTGEFVLRDSETDEPVLTLVVEDS